MPRLQRSGELVHVAFDASRDTLVAGFPSIFPAGASVRWAATPATCDVIRCQPASTGVNRWHPVTLEKLALKGS